MIKKLILGTMQTNCYVVYNDDHECFVIDPGAQGQKVARFLTENELDIKAILLTHGHFDHIGAAGELVRKLGIKDCYLKHKKVTCFWKKDVIK